VLKQIINQEQDSGAANPAPQAASPTQSPAPQQSAKPSSPSMSVNKNILSSDVEIKGTLKFSNDLIIDGRIEGEVNSEGDLTVGENAHIQGDINTRSVTVFGKIVGNIKVTDRCELKQNAHLEGDVSAGKLAIEEGAIFMGSSAVGAAKAGGAAPSKPAAAPATKPAATPAQPTPAGAK
jgi:cytoskeletal protein CcmA (bactofilin family)